jgi:hypothetical protein
VGAAARVFHHHPERSGAATARGHSRGRREGAERIFERAVSRAFFASDHCQIGAVEIAGFQKHSSRVSPLRIELLRGEYGFRRIGRIRPLVQNPQEDCMGQPWSLQGVSCSLTDQEEAKIALR